MRKYISVILLLLSILTLTLTGCKKEVSEMEEEDVDENCEIVGVDEYVPETTITIEDKEQPEVLSPGYYQDIDQTVEYYFFDDNTGQSKSLVSDTWETFEYTISFNQLQIKYEDRVDNVTVKCTEDNIKMFYTEYILELVKKLEIS